MEEGNIGMLDRLLRAVVGVTLLGWAIDGQVGVWGWFGVLPFLSGVVACCPLHALRAASKPTV